MATISNPKFNPALPESATNQRFIFDQPTVINQQTGQLSITGELLTPATPVSYPTPETIIPPSVPTVEPTPLVPTPKEKGISDLIAEITATSGLAGEKAAEQVAQEKAAGLETMRQAEQDYTAQLLQLQADWKNVESKMQLAAKGQEITAGGLAPITMAEQRKLSIQANTVSALLAATQGKITFAQSQVDRAVNAKYAQQEADRKAKIGNLELLLQDPALTIEQKNRANAQAAKLKKEEEAADKKKEDSKTIMDWAVKAAAQGATPSQAQAIAQIAMSDNPDLQAAMGLYAPFAEKPEKPATTADITEFKAFFPDADITTPQGQQQFLNWKTRQAEAGKAGVSEIGVPITPEDKRTLVGVGFSPTEINQIKSDISQYGLNKVLEGITDQKQKDAIQKIYGVEKQVELTRETISKLYNIPDNEEKTAFLSSWFGWGKTNKAKLDEIMDSIKKYQDIGLKDAEILKLIK